MTTTCGVSPSRGATALDLLSALAGPPEPLAARPRRAPIIPVERRAVRWCRSCGAPRDLGTRECPGCRLLAESRERIVTYLARHGMPPGGAVELARLADVPLRAVGELMTARAAPRRRRMSGTFQGIARTAR